MQYALINNGIVENVIMADAGFIATLTGYTDKVDVSNIEIGVGWLFDGTNFMQPEAVTTAPVSKQFTQLEYQSLFTLDELVAIEVAAETSATLRVLQRMQQAATYIVLDDPRTIQGMQALVSLSLLTQARYDEILTHTYDL